jgi:hypothetical protein
VTWRPTPTPFENDTTAADPANIVMSKVWDGSPIDPGAFDGSQPPLPTDPPACTVNPMILPVGALEPGQQLAGTTGTWTGATSYIRQWFNREHGSGAGLEHQLHLICGFIDMTNGKSGV